MQEYYSNEFYLIVRTAKAKKNTFLKFEMGIKVDIFSFVSLPNWRNAIVIITASHTSCSSRKQCYLKFTITQAQLNQAILPVH